MKQLQLIAGSVLALTSVWAMAQDAPESLLPGAYDKPAARSGSKTQASAPASSPPAAPDAQSTPVVQPLPGTRESSDSRSSPSVALPANLPSIKELEAMSPEDLDQLLGLKPKFDIPPAARRSLKQLGIIDESEGGFGTGSFSTQDPALIRAALAGNRGMLVSRWGHILLRRALASRMDAPEGMNPADFAAQRAALLVRMGEAEAARALVQDVDAASYTPDLTQAALDAYLATADLTGICPVMALQGSARKDADWQVAKAICASFSGENSNGLSQLDRAAEQQIMPRIDLLLAQKYAGAAGRARRAVTIEWDGVSGMNPWRFALTIATGLTPPPALMKDAAPRYFYTAATAPMLGLGDRAQGADLAGGAGIVSSAAMVDLYSQIYSDAAITGEWSDRADMLREAYVAGDAAARLAAMKQLWDGVAGHQQRYSRQVLTAYAAARLPVESGLAKDAPALVASMLAAGLDANALRWAKVADVGSEAWGQLVLAAPSRSSPVEAGAIQNFYSNDSSDDYRKTRFLLAGLAGLGRVAPATLSEIGDKLSLDLKRQTRWTRLMSSSADVGNQAMVALIAGLGMQGDDWKRMTPLYLYHIIDALHRVGLDSEARMIAAEAVARG